MSVLGSDLTEYLRRREINARAFEEGERDRWRASNIGGRIPSLELYTTAPCPMCGRDVDLEDDVWVCSVCEVQWGLNGEGAMRTDVGHMDIDSFSDPEDGERVVGEFNERHPVGTPVRYWPGTRRGLGRDGVTRTPAWLVGGTPVVSVDDFSGGIALSHIEVIGSEGGDQ